VVFGEGGKQTAEKKKKNRTIKVFMIKKEFDNWIGARVKENKKRVEVCTSRRDSLLWKDPE
jgi:hypothetical protein